MTLVEHCPLHEDSGDAKDFSGNGGDGQTNGGVTQGASGILGTTCYSFDGTDDSVGLDHSFTSAIDGLTTSAWIKTTANDHPVVGYDRSEYYRLGIGSNVSATGVASFNVTDSGNTTLDLSGNKRVDDGNWHHITGVYNSGTVLIYVDGIEDARGSQGSQIGTGTTRYGFIADDSEASSFNGSSNGYYYTGEIADVRLYNRALSPHEIQYLYEVSQHGEFVSPKQRI